VTTRPTPTPTPTVALTKQTRAGVATVTIQHSATAGLATIATLTDGTTLGRHCGPHHAAVGLPDGYVAAIGRLALTQDEADQITAAYQAATDALPRDLHAEREQLVDAANAAEHTYAAERAAAVDGGTFAAYLADGDANMKARVEDARHPETAAELAATLRQQTSQWMGH
jgi:Spy/CpxP family protein refolding chaperone